MKHYKEYKSLNLRDMADIMLDRWEKNEIFQKSISSREGNKPYVFYEGPPSANGLPGIHHVMSRAIKDIFCRFKTLKGFQVKRKAGWDTHGLPIEISVEKELGITKEDIGKKISITDYNKKCREAVMKYTSEWTELTRRMGYWVDMNDPYITFENKYIESVWHLLKKFYDKSLLYKGYTIQPYSPKAGTGLSTHELNQPGTYKMVKDTTIVAQFKVIQNEKSNSLFEKAKGDLFFLAWTTTPWTLPSNSALAVGMNIDYVQVNTFNQYTYKPNSVLLAKNVLSNFFKDEDQSDDLSTYEEGNSSIPWKIVNAFMGKDVVGAAYEQLLPYVQPIENVQNAFHVISGDFVNTEEGTGIVHIAPTFGADDMRVAKKANIPSIMIEGENGKQLPLVDLQGRFVKEVSDFPNEYVKEEYFQEGEKPENYKSVDVRIAIKLKEQSRAFKVSKYEHTYPHCWRTDKPILYYPLDSWFIKTTAVRDQLMTLNKTINWKPASTGSGRFGNWLENLQDWNLSRSRYWGIPLPLWISEDKSELICIGSLEELKVECQKSFEAGLMPDNPLADFEPGDMSEENYNVFDMHRPFVDDIILISASGKPLKREKDLIDVWFDSGSMPYAQWHYPFENKEIFENNFPADFIAEGVDQTRGWFFTLHAISTMAFGSVAFKNVVSNGLVLDKNGLKMSKRLGNAADPFETMKNYGPDAVRWYMISNAQPWDNLKFDEDGIMEVQRKFFGTLYNTYGFFALYANVDGFNNRENSIHLEKRRELDRWIISKLNSLIKFVETCFEDYEPTKAARAIQNFVIDDLSNWYVRLSRRIFWKGEYSEEKIAAYQTLFECLDSISKISSPIAPFFMDQLYIDLHESLNDNSAESVHLSEFPESNQSFINIELEQKMELAQKITSLVLGLRKKERIKVRQPLQKLMVPLNNKKDEKLLKEITPLLLSELNIKELEVLDESNHMLVKKIKPNFRSIGPKYGKLMKDISQHFNTMDQDEIRLAESKAKLEFKVNEEIVSLTSEDYDVSSQDIPGWLVSSADDVTVALDVRISEELRQEGLAREFINRIQNMRKESGLEVTDRISLKIIQHEEINNAIKNNIRYICAETLADTLDLVENLNNNEGLSEVEISEGVRTKIQLDKIS